LEALGKLRRRYCHRPSRESPPGDDTDAAKAGRQSERRGDIGGKGLNRPGKDHPPSCGEGSRFLVKLRGTGYHEEEGSRKGWLRRLRHGAAFCGASPTGPAVLAEKDGIKNTGRAKTQEEASSAWPTGKS